MSSLYFLDYGEVLPGSSASHFMHSAVDVHVAKIFYAECILADAHTVGAGD